MTNVVLIDGTEGGLLKNPLVLPKFPDLEPEPNFPPLEPAAKHRGIELVI